MLRTKLVRGFLATLLTLAGCAGEAEDPSLKTPDGATEEGKEDRWNFANDPANLQATIGWVNQQKGDSDAATWLPPNGSYRCAYVRRIVDVKGAYGLWLTEAEHDAIARVLAGCG